MVVACLLFKIRKAHKLDSIRFFNFLKNEVDDRNLAKNIKQHIRHGVAYKLQDEKGEIKGVFLAMKYNDHISLSYYLVAKEYRRKPVSLAFFLKCFYELKSNLPIIVMKGKNYNTYKKYFKDVGDGQLLFKGLTERFNDEMNELLKWVE